MIKNHSLKTAVILLGLTLLAYCFSFQAPFQLDDYGTIVDNPVIRNISNIKLLWEHDPTRFIPHLTFAINYHWHGLSVFGYHLLNFLLHLCMGVFVYLLTKQLLQLARYKNDRIGSVAFFITAIYLIHPLQTSTVTYAVQRSTLLAALMYLSAVYFYIRYRQEGQGLGFAIGAMVLGVFCKPNFVTLPLVLGLTEIIFLKTERKTKPFSWAVFSVFLLPIIVIPLLLGLWQARAGGLDTVSFLTRETDAVTRSEYAMTQIHVVTDYLRLMLVPIGQNLDYDYPLVTALMNPATLIRLAILLSLIVSAVLSAKKHKLYAYGILFGFLTLSIESSIFPISDLIFEHRMYLPLYGFLLAIIPIVMNWVQPRYRKTLGVGIILVMLVFSCYRNYIWSDAIRFLEDNYKKSPHKARVINRLGYAYLQNKQAQQAYVKFSEAIAVDPHYPEAYLNRGLLMYEFNNLEGALKDFSAAINNRNNFYQAYNNRGIVLAALGEKDWAMNDYDKALSFNRLFTEAYINRGRLYADEQQWSKALDDFNRAMKVDPTNAHIYNNRGIVFINLGQVKSAVDDFAAAAKIDPLNTSAVENYKNALKMLQAQQ